MKEIFVRNMSSTAFPSPFTYVRPPRSVGGGGWRVGLAFRNLRNNRLYSIINILGLSVSLAAVILIVLWVQDELGYDKFHKRHQDMYVVVGHGMNNGAETFGYSTAAPLSRAAKNNVPGVEEACAVGNAWNMGYVEYNNQKFFGGKYLYADSSFFSVFDATFLEGNAQNAFVDPSSVVITDKLSQKLFGNEPAVGKPVGSGTGKQYTVSAVVSDFPRNSSVRFDAVFTFAQVSRKDNWNMQADRNYLLLTPGTDLASVGRQIMALRPGATDEGSNMLPYLLQPLDKYHLYNPDGSGNGIKTVRIFSIIALSILIIACINYVNLVTARSVKRRKELGVRKLLGARKFGLFLQIMNESVLLFAIALVVAIVLIYILMPFYNQLTGKQIDFVLWSLPVLSACLAGFLLVIILAGIYPAVLLSSFASKDSLYRSISSRQPVVSLRKILVVFQFSCSVALILGTLVISRQMHFMQSESLAYKADQVFALDVYNNKNMQNHYQGFKADLMHESSVAGVSASGQNIMDVGNFAGGLSWEGMEDGKQLAMAYITTDPDLLPMMDIPMIAGEGFTGAPADSNRYILNQTAVKKMGIENPVGKWFDFWGKRGTIAGVVADFHFRHISEEMPPMVMRLAPTYWTIYVKPARGKIPEAIAAVEKTWQKYDSGFPFTYAFMDETFNEMHRSDIRTSRLLNIFSIIAILISSLGLFGLVTYTAEAKTKEIGIRKVLGASVASIVNMLSKEFLVLVGIAMLIAFPLAYYWLDKMLQDYAYHIDIGWWMFVAAGIVTVALTLLTVGWKAIRAATANPVKAIR